jgi:hypothetical protein
LLLKAADGHYRLVEELTACLQDQRQAGKVDHTLRDLVAQRVFAIACGSGLSNNVGGVKLFSSVLIRALRRAPFRSIVELQCPSNQGSLVIKVQVRKLGPTHASLRSHP